MTTPGDGYLGRSSGGALVTTNFPLIAYNSTFRLSCSSAFAIFETLNITGTVDNNLVSLGDVGVCIKSCRVVNASTGISAVGIASPASAGTVAFDCDASLTGASGGVAAIQDSATCRIIANRCTTVSSSAAGIAGASVPTIISNTVFSGGRGIVVTATGARACIVGNTITAAAGDGIDVVTGNTALQCIVGNIITDNGGYGIDLNNAAAGAFLAYNRTRDNTSGAINLGTDWVTATSYGHVTTDTGGAETDYVDAGTNDYRLIAASPAVNAYAPINASIGAPQRDQSGAGGAATESSHAFVG
jgi:hypothetical protein